MCYRSHSLSSRLRCQFRSAHRNSRMVREGGNQRQRGKYIHHLFSLISIISAHKLFRLETENFTTWKEVSSQFGICTCIKCISIWRLWKEKKTNSRATSTSDWLSCSLLLRRNCNISIPHIRRSRLFGYFQFRAYAMPRGLTCSSLMGARIYFRQAWKSGLPSVKPVRPSVAFAKSRNAIQRNDKTCEFPIASKIILHNNFISPYSL